VSSEACTDFPLRVDVPQNTEVTNFWHNSQGRRGSTEIYLFLATIRFFGKLPRDVTNLRHASSAILEGKDPEMPRITTVYLIHLEGNQKKTKLLFVYVRYPAGQVQSNAVNKEVIFRKKKRFFIKITKRCRNFLVKIAIAGCIVSAGQ